IAFMAALLSLKNCASGLAPREVAPPMRATTNSADRVEDREWARRFIRAPWSGWNDQHEQRAATTTLDTRQERSFHYELGTTSASRSRRAGARRGIART